MPKAFRRARRAPRGALVFASRRCVGIFILQEEAMNFFILRSTNHRSSPGLLNRGRPYLLLLLACCLTLAAPGLRAQQPADAVTVDKQTLEVLLERIDQLEARVRQLEAD